MKEKFKLTLGKTDDLSFALQDEKPFHTIYQLRLNNLFRQELAVFPTWR